VDDLPTLEAIRATRARLGDLVLTTPVRAWDDAALARELAPGTRVVLKEELFQRTGTFKPRGALAVMLELDAAALRRGVTAVSAGNHAIAVAYAAQVLGSTAKVVMPRTASPFRVAKCRELGAEIDLVEDVHQAFERVKQVESDEGRTFVHPFEGPRTALGTATLGLELVEQVPDLEAVVVPIGGGGLCAGVASAVKLARPEALVYGVEPEGADSMHRSFAAGSPQKIEAVRTIADSLGAPHAAPYSFSLCRRYVDQLVLVSDDAIRRAMRLLFSSAGRPAGGPRGLRRQHRRPHVLAPPRRRSRGLRGALSSGRAPWVLLEGHGQESRERQDRSGDGARQPDRDRLLGNVEAKRAVQAVPDVEQARPVRIRLRRDDRVVDAVLAGRHHQRRQRALDAEGQPEV
jgi:threonine dehydratase